MIYTDTLQTVVLIAGAIVVTSMCKVISPLSYKINIIFPVSPFAKPECENVWQRIITRGFGKRLIFGKQCYIRIVTYIYLPSSTRVYDKITDQLFKGNDRVY